MAAERSGTYTDGLSVLTTEVKMLNGAPSLFVNGQPHTGLMFYTPDVTTAGRRIAEFANSGVNIVTFEFCLGNFCSESTAHDFSPLDARMEAVLTVNPNALILPRVILFPSNEWLAQHPDERMAHRPRLAADWL